MGFKFQFITLAGFHALNYSMFDLAHGYARNQMSAYVELQEREFAAEERGYTADEAPARGRRRLLRPDRHHRGPDQLDHRASPARPKRASSTKPSPLSRHNSPSSPDQGAPGTGLTAQAPPASPGRGLSRVRTLRRE